MTARRLFASFAFVAASVLNPAYFAGCVGDGDDPGFTYDAEDMASLLRKANGAFGAEAAGTRYRVDVQVTPAVKPVSAARSWLLSAAYACGNRTLYASASACIDSSSMPVHGTLKITRLGASEALVAEGPVTDGELSVWSLNLSAATLRLPFAKGEVTLTSNDGQSFASVGLFLKP